MVRLFVIESYDRSDAGSPGPVPGLRSGATRLVMAVHLPADGVVLALVEGPDERTVTAAARSAGWEVDRVLAASPLLEA